MKKYLYLIPVAALAMTACTNESDEFVGSQTSREISFMPVNQMATRAAVDGTAFPTDLNMKVTAYQVEATGGSAGVYFDATTFMYQCQGGSYTGTGSYWGGTTARYWPLTPAYINFLAIANANADNATGVTWGTYKADRVEIVMSDNASAQRDLMYAIGNGAVTQSGNTLTFPDKVDMQFKHAQAWIDFKVKAKTDVETAITVNKITLNGASYSGTYTVTHTNYNSKTSQSVAGAWTALGDKGKNSGGTGTSVVGEVASEATAVEVPGWSAAALTTDFVTVGNGLMIVPDDASGTSDFIDFTINYTYDGKTYDYTYRPEIRNVDQKKHYIYEITFQLHEIFINPSVEDWADQTATELTIQ